MNEPTRGFTVVCLAVLVSSLPGPRPATGETVPDLHHRLYGLVIPDPTEVPGGTPGDLYVCLSCHGPETGLDTYQFLVERDCRACHQASSIENVVVDIKPGSAVNRFNLGSRGVLHVAILDSPDYEVTEIDASSLLLEGQVPPLDWFFRQGPGGSTRLVLKFSSEAVRSALGELRPGQTYRVSITGTFLDGSYLLGSDVIVAVPLSPRGRRGSR